MDKVELKKNMKEKLINDTCKRLVQLIDKYIDKMPKKKFEFSHKDVVLITYGDGFLKRATEPLAALYDFLERYAKQTISIVHILPFFPYSSDDGFSVIDYKQVNPSLGSWNDIEKLDKHFNLMFDAVINHISVQSMEFREFLKGNEKYRDFFITVGSDYDTSRVFRPRTHPLLTALKTPWGTLNLWTTFSTDQVDLNYRYTSLLYRSRCIAHKARCHRLPMEAKRHIVSPPSANTCSDKTLSSYFRLHCTPRKDNNRNQCTT